MAQYKLVIAEKPSVAHSLAAVIGATARKDGYLEAVSYTHLDVYKRQVFHMDEQLPFQFEWDWLAPSGLSTKDFIAPSSFAVSYTHLEIIYEEQ